MRSKTDQLREAERELAEVRKQQLLAQAFDTGPSGASSPTPSTSARMCDNCQEANPEGTTFCRQCGAMLSRS